MKIEQVPTFKRDVKKLRKKNYDLSKLISVIKLINESRFDELKRKHKLGSIKGTHPLVWHVHVDRQYNDDWLLFYRIDNHELVLLLLATGGHDLLKRVTKY